MEDQAEYIVDNKSKKQNKLYVTFRANQEEEDLYKWVLEESKIGGVANYFKQLALKDRNLKEGK